MPAPSVERPSTAVLAPIPTDLRMPGGDGYDGDRPDAPEVPAAQLKARRRVR
ncbi:hypothetical protein ACFTWS_40010 [Streptomyces sp. NPDC057027]|uniref:hypothetical protein n=1 Tax=Streptomyces sp. NPDC057027 TaxID=3346004 RepID=UPI003634F600